MTLNHPLQCSLWTHMHVGDGFWDKVDTEFGGLHELRIMWDPCYLTSDANVVKVR